MEPTAKMGMNRTGVQMSPLDIKAMLEGIEHSRPSSGGGKEQIAAMRSSYIAEADPVGTVPIPSTMKGAVKAGLKKMAGDNPEVLLDKLGERLAFERTGTRLYDALLTKYDAAPDQLPAMKKERLLQFRDEEAKHFNWVAEAIEQLGADPTAQTPCADVSGVEALGLMQVLDDPRTTLAQCLNAILIAELADNAGWELLIQLTRDLGKDKIAAQFEKALAEEQVHLKHIKQWVEQSVRQQAS